MHIADCAFPFQQESIKLCMKTWTQEGCVGCCRAMPIPVVGSVSEPEALGLGKLLGVHARKQTGTLVTGNDSAPDVDDTTCCGQFQGYFISRTGQPICLFCNAIRIGSGMVACSCTKVDLVSRSLKYQPTSMH